MIDNIEKSGKRNEYMELREELNHKKIGPFVGIAITLGIVLLLLALLFVTSFLRFWLGFSWLVFVPFAVAIIAGFWIVKYCLTDYVYVIQKGKIYFGRKIGAREKELFSAPVRDIRRAGRYDTLRDAPHAGRKHRYTFRPKREAYILDFGNDLVIFSPSENLRKELGIREA